MADLMRATSVSQIRTSSDSGARDVCHMRSAMTSEFAAVPPLRQSLLYSEPSLALRQLGQRPRARRARGLVALTASAPALSELCSLSRSQAASRACSVDLPLLAFSHQSQQNLRLPAPVTRESWREQARVALEPRPAEAGQKYLCVLARGSWHASRGSSDGLALVPSRAG